MESNEAFVVRLSVMVIIVFALALLLLTLMTMSIFWMVKAINKVHGKYKVRVTVRQAMRNGMLMNIMSHFPYSTFMLQEARDCPICFEQFDDDSDVVQLQCNSNHIFHYHCMNRYLSYEHWNLSNHILDDDEDIKKLCPLCRQEVQVCDVPVVRGE